MTHALKSIFVTLLLTLALNFTFGAKVIELRIDHATGNLIDPGTTNLGNIFDRGVSWEIMDANIDSFQIVPKYLPDDDPFTERPNRRLGRRLGLTVRLLVRTGEWNYSIIWIDKATHTRHTFDPKIAVKPITSPFVNLITLVGFVVTAITSILFFRKWQDVKQKLAEVAGKNK